MKRIILTVMIALCFALVLYGQKTAKNSVNEAEKPIAAAEELIAIEKKRSEAIAKHDMDFLNKLYGDDFRGVTAIGFEVTKENLMAVFKRDDPTTKFELDQLQARVFGETAVVTGRLTGKKTETGEIVHESKYMHVYVKRDGRWQLVAGEGTMISTPTNVTKQ